MAGLKGSKEARIQVGENVLDEKGISSQMFVSPCRSAEQTGEPISVKFGKIEAPYLGQVLDELVGRVVQRAFQQALNDCGRNVLVQVYKFVNQLMLQGQINDQSMKATPSMESLAVANGRVS